MQCKKNILSKTKPTLFKKFVLSGSLRYQCLRWRESSVLKILSLGAIPPLFHNILVHVITIPCYIFEISKVEITRVDCTTHKVVLIQTNP